MVRHVAKRFAVVKTAEVRVNYLIEWCSAPQAGGDPVSGNSPAPAAKGCFKRRSSRLARRQVNTVTATAARRAELAIEVGQVFTEFKETYGCRRIAQVLNNRGHACSVGLVADVMRELGLQAVQSRAYRGVSNSLCK